MELVTLKRLSHNSEGTCGVLLFNQAPVILTLENPWLENVRNISCIPTGLYECKKYSSKRIPQTFQVTNVRERTSILFHKGNTQDDSRGCILTGTKFGTLNGKLAVLESREAFRKFRKLVCDWDKFLLNILWT